MFFSITFITIAFTLYSVTIFSERLYVKKIVKWIVYTFAIGFSCDLIGTSVMISKANFSDLSLHSKWGIVALLFMGLHLVWAIVGYLKKGQAEKSFQKYSLIAWSVWFITLILGIPK